MKRTVVIGGLIVVAIAAVVVALLATGTARRVRAPCVTVDREAAPDAGRSPPTTSTEHRGFLYGRITTHDGTTYEGRLRWGGDEEAFWTDTFNGFKDDNPWLDDVPSEHLEKHRFLEVFGFEIARLNRPIDLGRPFMARFGDISRIEVTRADIHVTLENGSVFVLDRHDADDLADGVRVWDATHGVVDLRERHVRIVELRPTEPHVEAPNRLHGTVITGSKIFTGFVQWNRHDGVGTDVFDGRTAEGPTSVRYGEILSIARQAPDGARVTLEDGRAIVFAGGPDIGAAHRGIYVDDSRYGRVLVGWENFQRVDFSAAGSGPGYEDFPPGRPLRGAVTTREGRRFAGRLVFDLDESETTDFLDAPGPDADYHIPFALIASIGLPDSADLAAPKATITFHDHDHDHEPLQLELAGDLGETHAGLLIFVDGREPADYVPWAEVRHIAFERAVSAPSARE